MDNQNSDSSFYYSQNTVGSYDNNLNHTPTYSSDSSGCIFSTQARQELALERDNNYLSPSRSSYYTAAASNDQFGLSNPPNTPDRYDQLSSFDSLNEEFRLKWNEPVINYSDSSVSTYWVDRRENNDSLYKLDTSQTYHSQSNGNPFFPSYQLSSDTTITFASNSQQDLRNPWDLSYSDNIWDSNRYSFNQSLTRSSTFVNEPDLKPANFLPNTSFNDDDTIPCAQPSYIRYGEYLASLNENKDGTDSDYN